MERYRFFREHKYVSFRLNEFERKVAKTDFTAIPEVLALKEPLKALWELMKNHAAYEDSVLFALLRKKGEDTSAQLEQDHQDHDETFEQFFYALDNIAGEEVHERLNMGYLFYLSYRFFVAENLRHLHMEEAFVMPALQKHYTDEELSQVEASTYHHMTSSQMVEMLMHLFPHIDINDKIFFLRDIQKSQPEKFIQAWEGIKNELNLEEQKLIKQNLLLTESLCE